MATHLSPKIIATEVLERFLAETPMLAKNMINRKYEDRFAKDGIKPGAHIYARIPSRYLGYTLNATDDITGKVEQHNDQEVEIKVDKVIGCAYEDNRWDMTLTIDEFVRVNNYQQGVIQALRTQFATAFWDAAYKGVYGCLGTPGTAIGNQSTTKAAMESITDIVKAMQNSAIPEPYHLAVDANSNAAMVAGLSALFQPGDKLSKNYVKGEFGNDQLGFNKIFRDSYIPKHTCGARNTAYVVNGSNKGGDGILPIKTGTGATAISDNFTVANVYEWNPITRQSTGTLMSFRVTAVGAGGTHNMSFEPAMNADSNSPWRNVDALPADGAAVTFKGTASTAYPQNLAFNPDFMTVVTVDPIKLGVGNIVAEETVVIDGIALRMLRFLESGLTAKVVTRWDIYAGFKVINGGFAKRVYG